jgi:hypothetical protein
VASEFLNDLRLPEDKLATLRGLGAQSPFALLSIIEHSPAKFRAFFGDSDTDSLMRQLEAMVPPEWREEAASLPPFRPKLGAHLPNESDAERARLAADQAQLMQEIQDLRGRATDSPDALRALQRKEDALRALLARTT